MPATHDNDPRPYRSARRRGRRSRPAPPGAPSGPPRRQDEPGGRDRQSRPARPTGGDRSPLRHRSQPRSRCRATSSGNDSASTRPGCAARRRGYRRRAAGRPNRAQAPASFPPTPPYAGRARCCRGDFPDRRRRPRGGNRAPPHLRRAAPPRSRRRPTTMSNHAR